ncbi:hypothetical protein KM043_017604 [Ampulex compressa]|nr:hypothetical protein KM043_017604 [Ampulex compressa]
MSLQLLAFFSREINTVQKKYNAYGRELLSAHSAIKYFQYTVRSREFAIFTDYTSLTYALQKKSEKYMRVRHLGFIAQFSTDIRHILGNDNMAVEALLGMQDILTS